MPGEAPTLRGRTGRGARRPTLEIRGEQWLMTPAFALRACALPAASTLLCSDACAHMTCSCCAAAPRRRAAFQTCPARAPQQQRPEWLTPTPAAEPNIKQQRQQQQQQQPPPHQQHEQQRQEPSGGGGPAAPPAGRPRVTIPQRTLGVDYGTVWTGLATGEPGRGAPLRVERNARNTAEFCRALVAAALQHRAGGVVVGIPLRPGQRAGDPSQDTPHVSPGGGRPRPRPRAQACGARWPRSRPPHQWLQWL